MFNQLDCRRYAAFPLLSSPGYSHGFQSLVAPVANNVVLEISSNIIDSLTRPMSTTFRYVSAIIFRVCLAPVLEFVLFIDL